ncbi:MAG: aminopeptidase [Rhodopirellula sp.]|nr:aminopeptidase [Rhodopirellula sp.]
MLDPRIRKLAELLIDHSTQLQPGEKVLIEAFDLPDPSLVCCLVEIAHARGGIAVVNWKSNAIARSLLQHGSETSFALQGNLEAHTMEQMDAYIGIRGTANSNELSDVPSAQMQLYQEHCWHKVHHALRVPNTKWVVLRYPTASMAQSAEKSTEQFEDFYFKVCTADYPKLAENQKPLQRRMEAARQVRIVAPDTDLTFSIEGIPVVPSHGRRNIPDGEMFTSPVRDSVNGTITYNTKTLNQGVVFDRIRFEFNDGKIVNAECANGQNRRLNEILDTDEGARYIGEWSLGLNNEINEPMLDTLFDEKIGGSLHLTPGNAYTTADNGNRSKVHWDIVLIQTKAYGGGEVWFDDELLRKDGFFIPADLQPLNEGLA